MKTLIQKDICTLTLIAALVTIAKIWRQPKCSSVNEWIKKMWYIHTMEYYSAVTKNKILTLVKTWMDLEGVISKISQMEKDKHCIILIICEILKKRANKQN